MSRVRRTFLTDPGGACRRASTILTGVPFPDNDRLEGESGEPPGLSRRSWRAAGFIPAVFGGDQPRRSQAQARRG